MTRGVHARPRPLLHWQQRLENKNLTRDMQLAPLLFLLFVFLLPFLLIFPVEQQWQRWLADRLENAGWMRVLKALEHIGIVGATVAFIVTLQAFREESEVRRGQLQAFKDAAEVSRAQLQAFNEERESRAWSAIYEVKGTPGDGGRRRALEYLHGRKANLAGLPLANAYLAEIKLPGANLDKANLRGAYLREADLSWVNLSKARNLTQEQIDEAFYCDELSPPKLPAELNPLPGQKCDAEEKPIKE